jgi:tetratricopeptide (TPR) repeat protein
LLLVLACLAGPASADCGEAVSVDAISGHIEVQRPAPGQALIGWIEMHGAEWEVEVDGAAAPVWPERSGRVPLVVLAQPGSALQRLALRHRAGPPQRPPQVLLRCVGASAPELGRMQRLLALAGAHARLRQQADAWQAAWLALRLYLQAARDAEVPEALQWLRTQLLLLADLGQLPAPMAGWARVLGERARQADDRLLLAAAWLAEGRALRSIDAELAQRRLADSRQLFSSEGRFYEAAVALQNLCLQRRLLGEVAAAIDCYREAIAIHLRLEEFESALYTQLNRATALSRMGRYAEAQTQLEEAREIAARVPNEEALTGLKRQQAQYLTWRGQFDEALGLLATLRDYYDEALDPVWSAQTDLLIAATYRLAGEPGRAVAFYQRGEQRIQGSSQTRLQVRLQLGRAMALSTLGRQAEAAQVVADVQLALPAVGDPSLQRQAWVEIAEVLQASAQPEAAIAALQQLRHAPDSRFQLRRQLLAERLGIDIGSPTPDWEQELERTLDSGQLLLALQIGEQYLIRLGARGARRAAFSLAERLHSRLLPVVRSLRSPALRDAIAGHLHRLVAALAQQLPQGPLEASVGEQLQRMLAQLAHASLAPLPALDDERLLALERQLGAELLDAPGGAPLPVATLDLALPAPASPDAADALPQSLPILPPPRLRPGERLALPLVGAQTLGWLVYDGQGWAWWPGDHAGFFRQRDALLTALGGGHADADRIYRLAAELRQALGWERWLHTQPGTLWLGAHRALTPAPIELALPPQSTLRVGWVLSPTSIPAPRPGSLSTLGVAAGQGSALPALAAVESELERIRHSWPALPLDASAAQASRQALLFALTRPQALVHIATHGRASATRFEASGLWSTGDDGGAEFVSAHRLRGLPVGASLVVLSACDTGQGSGQVGIGVGGVASALVEAGAGAVVGARWAVGDRAAASFSSALHRHLARPPFSPHQALHAALGDLRGQPALRNPTHWAGWFVLYRGVPR